MKKLVAILLTTIMVTTLSACGSNLSAMEQIQKDGKLTLMTATGYPPYEYLGADKEPAGIDIDLAHLIADELGVELEILDTDFTSLIELLKSGKGQLLAAGMCKTEEREEQIDLSIAYGFGGQAIVVLEGTEFNSVDDIYNMRVGVQDATTNHIYAEEVLGITPLTYKSSVFAAEALNSDKIDCILIDKIPGTLMEASYKDFVCISEPFNSTLEICMGIAKGNEDFVAIVNEVLEKALVDGTIDALFQKHIDLVVAQTK